MNSAVRDSPVTGRPCAGISLETRIIEDVAEWDALRAKWQALHAQTPGASTALDFVWLREWWRVYGAIYGDGGLRIVTIWQNGVLVAALPLYLGQARRGPVWVRELRFLSSGEDEYEESCADYLGVLLRPGLRDAVMPTLAAAVSAIGWEHLTLPDMDARSPLLGETFQPSGVPTGHRRVVPRGVCPVASLRQGFDAYLSGLSANSRAQARSRMRKCVGAGGSFEIADAATAAAIFDELVALHQQRWRRQGLPGCFGAPRFVAFHRSLVRAWVPEGRAVLGRLSLEGRPLAVIYGFITDGKFDMYQLGVDVESESVISSPGIVANLLLMQALSERGVTAYDFLRGSSRYKASLSDSEQALASLYLSRPCVRDALFTGFDLVERTWRRLRRVV